MGFITQTFGNTFRTSSGTQQVFPTARKSRSNPKSSNDSNRLGIRVSSPAPNLLLAGETGTHKKRRHTSPDGDFRSPYAVVSPDPVRPSCSSSVASDEPLILPSSKGKGKSTSGTVHGLNQNQPADTNRTWLSTPRVPPRLQARPPTINSLDTHERSELVRRSRKLGSILGETPRLLDVEEDGCSAVEALDRLEGRHVGRVDMTKSRAPLSPGGRSNYRRGLTLDSVSLASGPSLSRPSSASRHSFLLNDENSSSTSRSPYQRSELGPRFGRTRSNVRYPPVLRLSTTATNESAHPYLGRRHSLDVSARKDTSLNAMDINVDPEGGSDILAPKAPSFDTSSLGSSTMPTFACPRSPSSFLDNTSLSSNISMNDSITNIGVDVPGRSIVTEQSLPPTPTTPITPILTQAEDARRKMRKLARHLGESVPADLVLGTAGARRAPHDHLTEDAAPQFLQVPTSVLSLAKYKANTGVPVPFSLGKPPLGHRKAQSMWKGADEESSVSSRRMVRRASSAEQLRVETPTNLQMTTEEKARNVRRAMKMLQLFGAPPPHELYTNIKSCSLDLPPSATLASPSRPSLADQRASVNSLRDLAYILDHDNRNSLLALIGDAMSDANGDPSLWPFADILESKSSSQSKAASQSKSEEEPFQARRARANKLAKFFGVSYRDLFDAVCAEDNQLGDSQTASGPSSHPALQYLPVPENGSEVRTNDGSKWVEPKSVDEVLDRLRAMKAVR